jgi:hypothetical protein
MTQWSAHRSAQNRFSGAIGTSGLPAPAVLAPFPRFPGEDAGHSLAEIAQRDLDAALQLLAERAQYITGAGGAAIALRRGGFNDMLCRASAGSNAPELGARLSAEFGLSGESVRTRLALRCDDTERDARVNREGCRHLGIASVAVMPIVSDDEVLGVFELFSGKVNAFGERDLSTLQRLGDMVETAVRLTRTAQVLPAEVIGEFVTEVNDLPAIDFDAEGAAPAAASEKEEEDIAARVFDASDAALPRPVAVDPVISQAVIKKPLLWSAASPLPTTAAESDQSRVPPILRNLRKCQACSFPVSVGRTFCVECEEKQWRGQLHMAPPAGAQKSAATAPATAPAVSRPHTPAVVSLPDVKAADERAVSPNGSQPPPQAIGTSALSPRPSQLPEVAESSEGTLPFLSGGGSSSESWFSAHKYILGAIVMVGLVLAVIAMLR